MDFSTTGQDFIHLWLLCVFSFVLYDRQFDPSMNCVYLMLTSRVHPQVVPTGSSYWHWLCNCYFPKLKHAQEVILFLMCSSAWWASWCDHLTSLQTPPPTCQQDQGFSCFVWWSQNISQPPPLYFLVRLSPTPSQEPPRFNLMCLNSFFVQQGPTCTNSIIIILVPTRDRSHLLFFFKSSLFQITLASFERRRTGPPQQVFTRLTFCACAIEKKSLSHKAFVWPDWDLNKDLVFFWWMRPSPFDVPFCYKCCRCCCCC